MNQESKEQKVDYKSLYDALYENNLSMIFSVDKEFSVIAVNGFGAENLGYKPKEMMLQKIINFIHPEDHKNIIEQLKFCFNNPGQIFQWEFRMSRRDGEVIWVKDNARTIESSDSNLILISCEDITLRKQAEQSLIEWKNRYELALNATDQLLYDYDINSNSVTLEGNLEGILGNIDSNLVEFDYLIERIHPNDRKMFDENIEKLKKENKPLRFEHRIMNKSNEYIFVDNNASFLKGGDSGGSRILGFISDITNKKRLEDKLIKSYKLESLSRLAGGIAHDFNNLLTGILGNLSLIKTYLNKNDLSYEKIIEIENTSIMAKDLAEKLFVFSTGGEPYKTTLSINNLLRESLDSVLKDSDVTFEITGEDSFDQVNADSEQIKQVFYNIILNAHQAMAGSGKISIDLKDITVKDKTNLPLDEGDYIEIRIKDMGIGISEEDLPKVFDPYYTTKNSGAGLGLSTAETIIKNHNGHITIDSSLRIETTVYIYLPVFHDKEAEAKPEADKELEYDAQLLVGKRVLVMDDEEFIRKVAGSILEHLGCLVDYAKEGNEAIEKYKASLNTENSFDYVILDLTVSEGIGGEETLKQLVKIDPDVKTFISSGYAHDPVVLKYKDYGFVGVINKPYEIEDFIKSFSDLSEQGNS